MDAVHQINTVRVTHIKFMVVSFQIFRDFFCIGLHAAALDGFLLIVFPARVHIGITRSYEPDQLPIWTCRVDFAGSLQQRCLAETRGMALETRGTQWPECDNPVTAEHSSRALVALRRDQSEKERTSHS